MDMAMAKTLRKLLLALMGILVGWWLFTAGYYLALTQGENEKIRLVTGNIKLKNFAVEQLKKENSVKVIESLRGMVEVDEAYVKATHQVLDDLTLFKLFTRPDMTISLISSREALRKK